MRKLPLALAALATTLAATACSGGTVSPVTAAESSTTASTATTAPASTSTTEGKSPEEESQGVEATPKLESERQEKDGKELSPQEMVELTIADLEAYWGEEMPKVYGEEYKPISGGFHAYSSTTPPPACGPSESTYEELKGNAFYCGDDDLVAWDEEDLVPRLHNEFGSFAVAVVFAHEWGHAIQGRQGLLGKAPTIVTEQQADCFAGSWARHVADGDSTIELPSGAMEAGLSALIDLRDPPGVIEAVTQGAHGLAFDRINAFQTGFDGKAEACVPLFAEPLPVTEVRFSGVDQDTGGNMPPQELLEIVQRALNLYWSTGASALELKFEPITDVRIYEPARDEVACDGTVLSEEALTGEMFVCVPEGFVAFDDALGEEIYENIGDWGLATLLSRQWVASIQLQNGLDDAAKASQLKSACFTGSFSAKLAEGDGYLIEDAESDPKNPDSMTLSPGDLDEAVITYLLFSERSDDPDSDGAVTAFERVRAFRIGFFGGEQACLDLEG